AELEGLVARHPLRERVRGQLMLALYRSGRQAEALDAYQEARRLLDDELGLEPGESLKALQKSILAHDPSLESTPPAEHAVAGEPLEGAAGQVLAHASCDVALFLSGAGPVGSGPIVVPFGAAEHDWAALELGAWVAQSTGAPLRLIGAASDRGADGRDASRLLADASLIVQRTADVVAEPLLATPGREGIRALAEGAGLLVVGLSERWRREGLGRVRTRIAKSPPAPTVFVRRGLRPGGLAPNDTRTRFTWSLTSAPS